MPTIKALEFITIVEHDGSTHDINVNSKEDGCTCGKTNTVPLGAVDPNTLRRQSSSTPTRTTETAQTRRRIRQAVVGFVKMDVEQKGFITEDDQKLAYTTADVDILDPQVEAYRKKQWKKIDRTGSGRITLFDFAAGCGLGSAHFKYLELVHASYSTTPRTPIKGRNPRHSNDIAKRGIASPSSCQDFWQEALTASGDQETRASDSIQGPTTA
jgi:hypothetical protein